MEELTQLAFNILSALGNDPTETADASIRLVNAVRQDCWARGYMQDEKRAHDFCLREVEDRARKMVLR